MTKYNQLNKDERDTIQYMLDKGHNFTSISNAIKKDRTTISKELEVIDILRVMMIILIKNILTCC